MQVLQIDKTQQRARKSGRWAREPRHRALGPGLAAAVAGVVGVAALTAALMTNRPESVNTVTIPAGISLVGTLREPLSTAKARIGQAVTLETREPFHLSEEFILPAGIVIRGRVLESTGGSDAPELAIEFTNLEVAGEGYGVVAEPFRIRGGKAPPVRRTAAGRTTSKEPGLDADIDPAVVFAGDQIVLPAGQRIRIRLTDAVLVNFKGSRTTRGS